MDYFWISETIFDKSFPDAQFKHHEYEVRTRRDRDKHEDDIIFICEKQREYKPNFSEYTCSEFAVLKKRCACFSIYRPPSAEKIKLFFEEMNEVTGKAKCKYGNLYEDMGNFNKITLTKIRQSFLRFF